MRRPKPGYERSWNDEPPEGGIPYIKLYRAPVREAWGFWVVNHRPQGVDLHYWPISKRTEPCTKKDGHCAGCKAKQPSRWAAYLAVWDTLESRVAMIELTQGAFNHCPLLLDKTADLRGRRVHLVRLGPRDNSPVRAIFSEPRRANPLIPPLDLKPALHQLWGLVEDSTVILDADGREEVPLA